MKILFFCSPDANYVPDLLLHGLRRLFGPDVVDWPRKDGLYRGEFSCLTPDQAVPGLMDDDDAVDRTDIDAKIDSGYFTLIFADIRSIRLERDRINRILDRKTIPLAFVDGEDQPSMIRPGNFAVMQRETDGSDHTIPLPMAMPVQVLDWLDRYADQPKEYSVGFLGARANSSVTREHMPDEVARLFPDHMIRMTTVPDPANPKPDGRLSRDEYYRTLQKCKIVLSLPGAGYDTFRYWENAACSGAHLAYRTPLHIPHDFREGREIVRFSTVGELIGAVDALLRDESRALEIGARSRAWLRRFHTTERRAEYVLNRLKRTFWPHREPWWTWSANRQTWTL